MVELAAHEPEVVMAGIGQHDGKGAPWIEVTQHDGQPGDQLSADEAEWLADTLRDLAAIIRAQTESEAR